MNKTYIDLVNIKDPKYAFGGYVRKSPTELANSVVSKENFILFMSNGNRMIVTESFLKEYTAIILHKDNVEGSSG